MSLAIRYYGRCEGGYGNIIWKETARMRAGKFPSSHPCHANPEPLVFSRAEQPETTDPLGLFRARGYLASCFPEGDGISFDPPEGRTHEQILADVRECFGFEIEVVRK